MTRLYVALIAVSLSFHGSGDAKDRLKGGQRFPVLKLKLATT